jgi:hypothetical protein
MLLRPQLLDTPSLCICETIPLPSSTPAKMYDDTTKIIIKWMERSRFRVPLNACVAFGGLWAIGCAFFINLSFTCVSFFLLFGLLFIISIDSSLFPVQSVIHTFLVPYLYAPHYPRYLLVIYDALLGLYKLTRLALRRLGHASRSSRSGTSRYHSYHFAFRSHSCSVFLFACIVE